MEGISSKDMQSETMLLAEDVVRKDVGERGRL